MILRKLALALSITALSVTGAYAGGIKNVIVVIGDGMGPQQIGLLNSYVKHAPNSIYKDKNRRSAWESLAKDGVLGLAYTDAANVLVTDSAASATQFASGKMSGSEMVGTDLDGHATETMLEIAAKMGKSTGLITDTRVTHATPAGFGFSYSRSNLPEGRDLPGEVFEGSTFKPNFNFGSYDILDKIYQQTASYVDIFSLFDALPAVEQTPAALAGLVNSHTQFAITEAEAARVLETEDNEYFVEGHGYLSAKTFPKVNEFKEFFVYGNEVRHNLLASIVGKQQNTVWATGTHTNTPVPIVAWGPESVTNQFNGLIHTTDWAKFAIQAMK